MRFGSKISLPLHQIAGPKSATLLLPNTPQEVKTIAVQKQNGLEAGVISAVNLSNIKAGTWNFYIYGSITYQDVYGRSHQTNFCAFLNPETLSTFRSCEGYNKAN